MMKKKSSLPRSEPEASKPHTGKTLNVVLASVVGVLVLLITCLLVGFTIGEGTCDDLVALHQTMLTNQRAALLDCQSATDNFRHRAAKMSLGTPITIRLRNASVATAIDELSSRIGLPVNFERPRTEGPIQLDFKDVPAFEVLNHLASHGEITVAGIPLDELLPRKAS